MVGAARSRCDESGVPIDARRAADAHRVAPAAAGAPALLDPRLRRRAAPDRGPRASRSSTTPRRQLGAVGIFWERPAAERPYARHERHSVGTRGSLPTPGSGDDALRRQHELRRGARARRPSSWCSTRARASAAWAPTIEPDVRRIDLLLTHLHLDHIEGLGFFAPLFRRGLEVHVWGPASTTLDLRARLTRYLSPPIFPVRLRDLPCTLELHDVVSEDASRSAGSRSAPRWSCHPGPTVGFRISEGDATLAYLPDHEPALGAIDFPRDPEWTSGFDLAADADVLIHDAQYGHGEYEGRVGWGHSELRDLLAFATASPRAPRRPVPLRPEPHRRRARQALRRRAPRAAAVRLRSAAWKALRSSSDPTPGDLMHRLAAAALVLLAATARAQSPGDFDGDGRANALDNCALRREREPARLERAPGRRRRRLHLRRHRRQRARERARLRSCCARALVAVSARHRRSREVQRRRRLAGLRRADVAPPARRRSPGARRSQPVCRAFVGASELPVRMAVAGDSITRGFARELRVQLGLPLPARVRARRHRAAASTRGSTAAPRASSTCSTRYRVFDASIARDGSARRGPARACAAATTASRSRPAASSAQTPGARPRRGAARRQRHLQPRLRAARRAAEPALHRRASGARRSGSDCRRSSPDLPADATVYLGSVPRVQDLYAAGLAKQDPEYDVDCELAWRDRRHLPDRHRLRRPSNGETQASRLPAIAARQRRYNEILREEALAYDTQRERPEPARVRVVAEYTDESTPSVGTLALRPDDINGSDCFHPSLRGPERDRRAAVAEQPRALGWRRPSRVDFRQTMFKGRRVAVVIPALQRGPADAGVIGGLPDSSTT